MPGRASLGNTYIDGFLPVKGHQELGMKDASLGLFPRDSKMEEWDGNRLSSKEVHYLGSYCNGSSWTFGVW